MDSEKSINFNKKVPDLFPPSVWNVHNVTLNDGESTNNQTQGWNHRFSKLIGQYHPTI